jgi:hypothetical protein
LVDFVRVEADETAEAEPAVAAATSRDGLSTVAAIAGATFTTGGGVRTGGTTTSGRVGAARV